MSKIATVFGGSGYRPEDEQYTDGVRLGNFLTQEGYTVQCGGYYGLMEAVSKGVREAGGRILGITNAAFDPKNPNEHISEERKQSDLFDRMRQLIDGDEPSDLFVVQEGSLGTLTELFATWCLAYTQCLSKEVRICLVGKAWPEVIEALKTLPITQQDYQLIEIYRTMNDFFDSFHEKKS